MEYLLYGLAIYCLLIIGRYLIIFQRLLGLTLQYINYDFTAKDQIPVYIRDLFEIPLLELEQLEFKFCCYLNVAQMTYLDASKTWQMLLYNEEFKTFASVDIRSLPESVKLFTINFFTFLEDNLLLQTMTGRLSVLLERYRIQFFKIRMLWKHNSSGKFIKLSWN